MTDTTTRRFRHISYIVWNVVAGLSWDTLTLVQGQLGLKRWSSRYRWWRRPQPMRVWTIWSLNLVEVPTIVWFNVPLWYLAVFFPANLVACNSAERIGKDAS